MTKETMKNSTENLNHSLNLQDERNGDMDREGVKKMQCWEYSQRIAVMMTET